MDRSPQSGRSPAALLVFALFASLIGAVRVWQSPAPSEAHDLKPVPRNTPEIIFRRAAQAEPSYRDSSVAHEILFADDVLHGESEPELKRRSTSDLEALLDSPSELPTGGADVAEVAQDSPVGSLPPVATPTPLPSSSNPGLKEPLPSSDRVTPQVADSPMSPELMPNSEQPIPPSGDKTCEIAPVEMQPADVTTPAPQSTPSAHQIVEQIPAPAHVLPSSVTTTWPVPEVLRAEIEHIQAAHTAEWQKRTIEWLDAFQTIPATDQTRLHAAINELDRLSRLAEPLARQCQTSEDAVALRTTGYALSRRVQIWRALLPATSGSAQARVRKFTEQDQRGIMQSGLAAAVGQLKTSRHFDAWSEFLLIRELSAVINSEAVFDPGVRLAIAIRILERMQDEELSAEQQHFLSQPGLRALHSALTVWSTQPVDGPALLRAIEQLERQSTASASRLIAEHWCRLEFSMLPEHRHLADVIDKHYRNANVRLAANENFLNRLVPAMRSIRSPVREMILGAEVSGQSASRMKMKVDLLPDDERIKASLKAQGEMAARTQSRKGSIIFHNRNKSHFLIQKLFTLDSDSVRVGRTAASAAARSNLLGMKTQYDTFPVIGSIVRRVAIQKHFESKVLARRVFEKKVEENARRRVDMQVDHQLAKAQHSLQERILDPLEAMELNPTALAMNSTNDRMVMRGRLAADHQVGAFTARPRATPNNMVEVQIHQSAINNFLDQVQLEGREGPLPVVFTEIATDLGFGDIQLPEDIPEDVTIRLADQEPVRVDCIDDEVKVTVRVARLRGERLDLRNFEVSAFYVPEIDGMLCDLKRREGGIQVSCRRKRFAVRAIFTKVFSPNRPIPMVFPEFANDPRMRDLELDQLVLRDGWVGLSVGQCPRQPTTMQRQPNMMSSRGSSRR